METDDAVAHNVEEEEDTAAEAEADRWDKARADDDDDDWPTSVGPEAALSAL